jgi:anti-sigma factor RsiW
MSCSPFDLRDYFLKELAGSEQSQVEAHVKNCGSCREEVERLRIMETALFSQRDEEIPQRIAFVSDPVFQPPVWRRAWAAFWGSSGRLAFAGAAMLSGAIVFSTIHGKPAPVNLAVQPAAVQTISETEIQARVDAAVAKAVAASVAQLAATSRQLVAEIEDARKRLKLAAGEYDMQQMRVHTATLLASGYGAPIDAGGAQ